MRGTHRIFLWLSVLILFTSTPDNSQSSVNRVHNQIAFVSDRDGLRQIYLMNLDGTNVKRLTNLSSNVLDIDCSPVGDKILFSTLDGVSILDLDTLSVMEMRPNAEDPAWSPNENRIAFSATDDGNYEIYTLDLNRGIIRRLTNNNIVDRMPDWSGDGKQITFYSERENMTGIFIMGSDGSNQTRLTANSLDLMPDWSPVDNKIAYVSQHHNYWNIYSINLENGDDISLGDTNSHNYDPNWSPDGSKIVFTSERDENPEIYVVRSDGLQSDRLTKNRANDTSPCWIVTAN